MGTSHSAISVGYVSAASQVVNDCRSVAGYLSKNVDPERYIQLFLRPQRYQNDVERLKAAFQDMFFLGTAQGSVGRCLKPVHQFFFRW